MRTRVRGWRRRPNPLRRRSDVVEAWTVLAVAVLLFVGAPLVGAFTAWWAHGEARALAAEQRDDRRLIRAEVVGRAAASGSLPSVQTGTQYSYRATVRWTEPGEALRTATARVPSSTRAGEKVDVWLDSRGRNVPPPVDGAAVWQHAITFGVCSAGGTAAVVLCAHWAVRQAAMRHRLAEWEEAWARTEPQWTHRRA
ncbi:hypothetical protein [Streptomyces sp. DH24]|uniref:Rv1733c family protein n=1 Tax=Streptomyces sp. DH24 TaxID=3040123 RepID=UPI0024429688|nr:hypothetical protein [Streptomyces sp. DH24]MDG9719666.1 hypothetical protein [Streptomyces sp. DH24]